MNRPDYWVRQKKYVIKFHMNIHLSALIILMLCNYHLSAFVSLNLKIQ